MTDPNNWPDPTPEMLASPRFQAVWQRIKGWDISTGELESESSQNRLYEAATGNHVRAILDALDVAGVPGE